MEQCARLFFRSPGGPIKNETVEVKREHFSEGGKQGSMETTITTSTEEQTIPMVIAGGGAGSGGLTVTKKSSTSSRYVSWRIFETCRKNVTGQNCATLLEGISHRLFENFLAMVGHLGFAITRKI